MFDIHQQITKLRSRTEQRTMDKVNIDSYKVVMTDMSIRQFPVHGVHAVPEPASVHVPVSI